MLNKNCNKNYNYEIEILKIYLKELVHVVKKFISTDLWSRPTAQYLVSF